MSTPVIKNNSSTKNAIATPLHELLTKLGECGWMAKNKGNETELQITIEMDEDEVLGAIAESRDKPETKFFSHEEAWA